LQFHASVNEDNGLTNNIFLQCTLLFKSFGLVRIFVSEEDSNAQQCCIYLTKSTVKTIG